MKPATRAVHPGLLPMLDCPKWKRCSAPTCPLDPEMANRSKRIDESAWGGPEEDKCGLGKAKRMRLGADLPTLGLFPRELAGLRSWQAKTEDERAAQIARNRRNLGLP